MEIELGWWPQPRQLRFLRACGMGHPFGAGEPGDVEAEVVGYGGAAGGGKSDALLMMGIVAGLTWPGCKVGFFRRTYPELDGPGGAIQRSLELMSGWAHWNGGKRRWILPTGSLIQFCHCQREADVYRYQSQQFDLLLLDEATHFTEFQVRYLRTRNRATVDGVRPIAAMGTNPGNVGHLWFKREFVDAGPAERVQVVDVEGEGEEHLFVPARLSDNAILEERDPGYRRRLMRQPAALRRALLEGDWDVFAGQVFGEFRRDVHVVRPFELEAPPLSPPRGAGGREEAPRGAGGRGEGEGEMERGEQGKGWVRWRAVDWGYAAPMCCLWLAKDLDSGQVVVYRELYEAGLTDPEQVERIVELTGEEKIKATVADPSMWTKRSTERETVSTADVYRRGGVRLRRADNDRLGGKRRVHEALAVGGEEGGVTPPLQIFETCGNLVRTLPALPYDQVRVEDVDTGAEDHAYDALRYGLSWRVRGPREAVAGEDVWDRVRRGGGKR